MGGCGDCDKDLEERLNASDVVNERCNGLSMPVKSRSLLGGVAMWPWCEVVRLVLLASTRLAVSGVADIMDYVMVLQRVNANHSIASQHCLPVTIV